uniref:Uncharacterized protein n=1 Tax=Anguilla anguilla TaxID=7936 RepID=A0A0E9TT36_ANGAN
MPLIRAYSACAGLPLEGA